MLLCRPGRRWIAGLKEILIRSTRATAAVARLNRRVEGLHYLLVVTSAGLFKLRKQAAAEDLTEPLELDAFVSFVDAQGPQISRRITKNDAAFALQLAKNRS